MTKTKKLEIPYQLIIRSENRINYANTNANDFSIYLPEFLPNDCQQFRVRLLQVGITKKALQSDANNGNRLNANIIEVNAFFNTAYGFDTLYQGMNRYCHFFPCYEVQTYCDIVNAPMIVCNKIDQNFLRIQVFGINNSTTPPTRSLLTNIDGSSLVNCQLIFEVIPIFNDVDEY